MKQTLSVVLFGILICTLLSCKKELSCVNCKSFTGQWKWVNSTGGFSGNDTIKPSLNATVTFTLAGDLSYNTFLNGQVKGGGKYDITTIQNDTIIHFDNPIRADNLFLQDQQLINRSTSGKMDFVDYHISEPYTHHFEIVK